MRRPVKESAPQGWAGQLRMERRQLGGVGALPLPQAPFPPPQVSPEFRLHLSNLHPQLGCTVVFEHRLGQPLQERILPAHQLRRERTRQVETRAGRAAPLEGPALGIPPGGTPFPEKGTPRSHTSSERGETHVRTGTPTQAYCRARRAPIGGGVSPLPEPPLRLVRSSAPARPPRRRPSALWPRTRPGLGLRGAGPGAPPAPTKMVAPFRSGSLSSGLSTDISAAAEPPRSARRPFKPSRVPPPVGGAGLTGLGGASCQLALLKEPLPRCLSVPPRCLLFFNYVHIVCASALMRGEVAAESRRGSWSPWNWISKPSSEPPEKGYGNLTQVPFLSSMCS